MMATAVAPPPRTRAEKKDEFFRVKDRMVEFGSSQYVEVRPIIKYCLHLMTTLRFPVERFGTDSV